MDRTTKPSLMLIAIIESLFLGFVMTVFLVLAIDSAPVLIQYTLKPSTSTLCSKLRAGMARGQAQGEIERRLPPRYESIQNDHLEFSNFDDGVCRVYFENQKDQVKSVQFEQLSPPKWDLRGD
jgi:hypothetical protein